MVSSCHSLGTVKEMIIFTAKETLIGRVSFSGTIRILCKTASRSHYSTGVLSFLKALYQKCQYIPFSMCIFNLVSA